MQKRWWHNSIVYQIYPKSFLDTNGDGIGDLNGISAKLDYLKELGIDIIWISPFFKSPMIDNGYDISDYKSIDPRFGTMTDFNNLIDRANEKGMKILIDLVVNHTSNIHPWFLESKSSKDNSKRDWYIWKDGKNFNNWRSVFGGSVWEYDENTDSSYFHYFHKAQPCLNWENPEVREAIYEMVTWWLDKGIGGFRVDAINVIKKGPLSQQFEIDAEDGLASANQGVVDIEGIEIFLDELAQRTFNKYDILTVAEADIPSHKQALWTGPKGFFDMAFQFKHSDLDIEQGVWHKTKKFDLIQWKKNIDLEQSSLTKNTWAGIFLENHDHPRSISKYLGDEAPIEAHKMLATSYFFLRGTPFVYQGQEIGLKNIKYDAINDYDDIATIDHFQRALQVGFTKREALEIVGKRSRDNSRYPMQWNNSKFYGFSTVEPWLKTNSKFPEITVENAINNSSSLYYYFQEMIKLRKSEQFCDIFAYGKFELILESHKSIFAYIREFQGTRVLVLLNFSNKEVSVDLDFQVDQFLLGNYNKEIKTLQNLILKPYQSGVFRIL